MPVRAWWQDGERDGVVHAGRGPDNVLALASISQANGDPMLVALSIVTLFAYTLVMSQPLFFAFALGRASLALSGPAYTELRQRINSAITRPLVVVYALTFVACLTVAALAAKEGATTTAAGVGLAALTLAVDLVLAAKGNVPLNAAMNQWEPAALPRDWASKRAAWHRVFAVRQIVLCVGYVAFVAGAFGRF